MYQIVPSELPNNIFNKLKETSIEIVNSESNPILILYNLRIVIIK